MFDLLEQSMSSIYSGDKAVTSIGSVGNLAILFANIVVFVGIGLNVIALAISFIQFATSSGDEKAMDKAKTSLTWSVIGLFVALAAYTIKNVVLNLVGGQGRIG